MYIISCFSCGGRGHLKAIMGMENELGRNYITRILLHRCIECDGTGLVFLNGISTIATILVVSAIDNGLLPAAS